MCASHYTLPFNKISEFDYAYLNIYSNIGTKVDLIVRELWIFYYSKISHWQMQVNSVKKKKKKKMEGNRWR